MMKKYLFSLTNSNILTLWILIIAEIPGLILKVNLQNIKFKDSQNICVRKNQLVNLLKMYMWLSC